MLAWIAILLAVPAILGLLPQVVGVSNSPYPASDAGLALGVLTAVSSWAVALLATLIAGVRLIGRGRHRRALFALGLAGPGAVLGTAALVLVVVVLGNLLGLFGGNRAEDLARPAVDSYLDQGGSVICDNGDGGNGPVNRSPWFTAYLDVPDDAGSTEEALEAMREAGYADATVLSRESDEVSPGSFSVGSDAADGAAQVAVHPRGPVPLRCSDPDVEYGTDYRAPEGRAVVVVSVSLPRTD